MLAAPGPEPAHCAVHLPSKFVRRERLDREQPEYREPRRRQLLVRHGVDNTPIRSIVSDTPNRSMPKEKPCPNRPVIRLSTTAIGAGRARRRMSYPCQPG